MMCKIEQCVGTGFGQREANETTSLISWYKTEPCVRAYQHTQTIRHHKRSSRSLPKAVQHGVVALEAVHNIAGRDGLAVGVLRVDDGVAHNFFQKGLENVARLTVHGRVDALDAAAARQPSDCRLGDALQVVPLLLRLAVALARTRAHTSQTFAAFTPAGRERERRGGRTCSICTSQGSFRRWKSAVGRHYYLLGLR